MRVIVTPFYDYDDGGDDLFLFYNYPRNKRTNATPSVVPKDAENIGSDYTSEEQIFNFLSEVDVSSSEDKDMVILEACSLEGDHALLL